MMHRARLNRAPRERGFALTERLNADFWRHLAVKQMNRMSCVERALFVLYIFDLIFIYLLKPLNLLGTAVIGQRQGTPWMSHQCIAGPHRDKEQNSPSLTTITATATK